MEFCPKCGCVLTEKNGEYKCARCNYKSKSKIKIEVSERIDTKPEIGVVSSEETDIHPIINSLCPKCGNKEAWFWTSQTRAGDEAETKFFRCTKCKYTWREYQ